MAEIFFVSLGAILGANARFLFSNKLKNVNLIKNYHILFINTFASFCLGFFLSLIADISSFIYYYQLVLFFSIGFMGSLSTFSSFIYEVFDLCLELKFFKAIKLFVIACSFGITSFVFGFLLGN